MHTSKLLRASDFQYWRLAEDERISVDFEKFCPDYHELDRVGVISPCLEDGILYTGDALLALTTAFYDVLRSRTTNFFDYPQHFAFIGASKDTVHTRGERLPMDQVGTGWGNLDVWPDSKWIATPRSLTGMLKKVFDFQINRLFLPQDLKPGTNESPLPTYARKMLGTRLKAVYYYNTPIPNVEIHSSQQVADLVQKSIAELPNAESASEYQIQGREVEHPAQSNFPYVERYRQVNVDDFLDDMTGCFDGN
jgi:hypothetical protein